MQLSCLDVSFLEAVSYSTGHWLTSCADSVVQHDVLIFFPESISTWTKCPNHRNTLDLQTEQFQFFTALTVARQSFSQTLNQIATLCYSFSFGRHAHIFPQTNFDW